MPAIVATFACGLLLTSCSSAEAQLSATESIAVPTPTSTSVDVNVTTSKSGKTSTGVEVTFKGLRPAEAAELSAAQDPGRLAVVVQFEYRNTAAETIPLQSAPLTVFSGTDKKQVEGSVVAQDGTTRTALPKQIAPGAVVAVVGIYYVPAGSPLTIKVKPSGSAVSGEVPSVVFTGIAA
ncbi:hypothetical protein AYX22_16760 [Arthrobacter sp. D5-1]|nr:hypothetical protein AYX22_16760 [Arthrobacter sp. D5-1]